MTNLENMTTEELIEYKEKVREETNQHSIKEKAYKVNINSLYGALGNAGFRFYDVRKAEAITVSGQLAIRWIEKKLNEFLNKSLGTSNVDYVIGVDTDSNFLKVNGIVKNFYKGDVNDKIKVVDFLDTFCKKILDPFIEKKFKELAEYMNAHSQKMEMARDVIADRGVWKAKKMYCLNVYDTEGVRHAEPKLKIMGIEVQRSSTPKVCREKLKECVKIILTQDENTLIDYVQKFQTEFRNLSPEEVAFPRGVNNIDTYADQNTICKKGTPIAVKGALYYNRMLKELKIAKKYTKIGDGEKIKFLYLKEPNIVHSKVLSFPQKLPKEFDIRKYVDYDTQFDKAFLTPLQGILKVIGWKHEKQNSLDSFFG